MDSMKTDGIDTWANYEQVQGLVERSRRGGAMDEAAENLVRNLAHTPADRVTRRFVNLVSQMKRRSRRRREIDTDRARRAQGALAPDVSELAAAREVLSRVREAFSDPELAIEDLLAADMTYGELSHLLSEPHGTIKARVARARARVRGSSRLGTCAA